MSKRVLSSAVTGTSVYKSEITRNGSDAKSISWQWAFTGTMTGTVVIEGTNSPGHLVDYDEAGGTDTTDKASWLPVFVTFSSSNTAAASKAISAAVVDSALLVPGQFYAAYRFKYTNASNSGNVTVDVQTARG